MQRTVHAAGMIVADTKTAVDGATACTWRPSLSFSTPKKPPDTHTHERTIRTLLHAVNQLMRHVRPSPWHAHCDLQVSSWLQ
jgi:hypothetical protein